MSGDGGFPSVEEVLAREAAKRVQQRDSVRLDPEMFRNEQREHVRLDPDQEALAGWWRRQTEAELEEMLPKATSYGSIDLDVIGHALRLMIPNAHPDTSNDELGVAFYLLGKAARILSAMQAGQQVSPDSWKDAAIYARMGMRARQEGAWLP